MVRKIKEGKAGVHGVKECAIMYHNDACDDDKAVSSVKYMSHLCLKGLVRILIIIHRGKWGDLVNICCKQLNCCNLIIGLDFH